MGTEDRFEGHTAVVTGAARGIGKAIALRLAREGAAVVVTDIAWPEELEATAVLCESAGSGGVSVAGDLADPQTATRLVTTALERFGTIDMVVNNAFWEEHAPVGDVTLEGWDKTLRVTLTAAMLMARAALPWMLEHGGGTIVNVSSAHAIAAGYDFPAYEAAKAGLLALTRSIAVDYGRRGIRCNAVAPGLVLTERLQPWWDESDARRAAMLATIPIGRPGRPEDIAGCVAFLLSEDAAFVNGSCLLIDGGATCALAEVAALDLVEKVPARSE